MNKVITIVNSSVSHNLYGMYSPNCAIQLIFLTEFHYIEEVGIHILGVLILKRFVSFIISINSNLFKVESDFFKLSYLFLFFSNLDP